MCPTRYVQGVLGNKKCEFWAEAQFLRKLHANNGYILLNLLLKGTKPRLSFFTWRFIVAHDPLYWTHQRVRLLCIRRIVSQRPHTQKKKTVRPSWYAGDLVLYILFHPICLNNVSMGQCKCLRSCDQSAGARSRLISKLKLCKIHIWLHTSLQFTLLIALVNNLTGEVFTKNRVLPPAA